MSFKKLLSALISLTIITACSSGGGDNAKGIEITGEGEGTIDFGVVVDPDTCLSPMDNVFNEADYYIEEFARNLQFGDAPCLKKAIEKGNIDVNQKIKESHFGDLEYPIFIATNKKSLFFANEDGQAFLVLKVLFEAGAKIDTINENGDTPLLHALKYGEPEKYASAPQYLIQTGKSDVHRLDRSGDAAIHYMMEIKDINLLKSYVASDGSIELPNSRMWTPIFIGLSHSWVEGSKYLIDQGVDITTPASDSDLPLHRAIQKDLNSIALLLIDKMSLQSLNHKNDSGGTAFSTAVNKRSPVIAQTLLDKDISVNNTHGRQLPLHSAMGWNNAKIAQQIISKTNPKFLDLPDGAGKTALILATENKNLQYMKSLYEVGAGINVNQQGSLSSPLHVAAENNFIAGLEFLVKQGANLNIKDAQLNTPLHLVTSIEGARTLIQSGAELDHRNEDNDTPIAVAVKFQRENIFSALEQAGASLQWDGWGNKTLLHAAVMRNLPLATEVLAKKLDVNAVDNELKTPLFFAANEKVLGLLLQQSPNLEMADNKGNTAFTHILKQYLESENPEELTMAKQLTAQGANANHADTDGETVLFDVIAYTNTNGKNYFPEIMQFLATLRIDFNKSNQPSGKTAAFYVDSPQEVTDLLYGSQSGSIDLGIKDSEGLTADETIQIKIFKIEFEIETVQKQLGEVQKQIEELGLQQGDEGYQALKGQEDQFKTRLSRLQSKKNILEAILAKMN